MLTPSPSRISIFSSSSIEGLSLRSSLLSLQKSLSSCSAPRFLSSSSFSLFPSSLTFDQSIFHCRNKSTSLLTHTHTSPSSPRISSSSFSPLSLSHAGTLPSSFSSSSKERRDRHLSSFFSPLTGRHASAFSTTKHRSLEEEEEEKNGEDLAQPNCRKKEKIGEDTSGNN
ncbi:hypothetical protein CSUI_004015, partial [Cystoisospora suis]